jgi:tryptophanyl-tRNA synthetase
MSKSDPSDMSRINLTDTPDLVAQKIRKARTDPEPLPESAEELAARPEARNLVAIYATLADESVADVLARFAGQGFGAFKPALAELAVETLRPIGARIAGLTADPAELDRLLAVGAERARAAAAPVLAEAYAAMGL